MKSYLVIKKRYKEFLKIMGLKKIKWPEAFNLGAFQRSNFKNIPFSTYLHIYLLEGVMGSDAAV